jgi:hypothetical protein
MNRVFRYILFVFLLWTAASQKLIASADETASAGVIARPVVEYKSAALRDPFSTYFVKEEPKDTPQDKIAQASSLPKFDTSKLKVQGIIWGVKNPQAIINDQVLTVGSTIEGAEILSIEKKGITLSFNGVVFDLISPGQTALLNK